MGNIFAFTIQQLGLHKGSDPTTGAGALWLALTLAAVADAGDYTGKTPVREVINRWTAAGYLDSLIGRSFSTILEGAALRRFE